MNLQITHMHTISFTNYYLLLGIFRCIKCHINSSLCSNWNTRNSKAFLWMQRTIIPQWHALEEKNQDWGNNYAIDYIRHMPRWLPLFTSLVHIQVITCITAYMCNTFNNEPCNKWLAMYRTICLFSGSMWAGYVCYCQWNVSVHICIDKHSLIWTSEAILTSLASEMGNRRHFFP